MYLTEIKSFEESREKRSGELLQHYSLITWHSEQSELLTASFSTAQVLQVEASWNVMAHAQKPDLVFQRNGRVHLNRRGRQFSRLLVAEVCASAVVMLDTLCSEVVWRVLATHSIRQFLPSLSLSCVTMCHHISTGVYNVILRRFRTTTVSV